MSSHWGQYAYAQQFVGNLHKESSLVPVRVDTCLRVMTEEAAREDQMSSHELNCVPEYVFAKREDLPPHQVMQAVGRHYFKW
jgi:hypothetical protein